MTTLDLRPSGCPRPGSAWLERLRADHDHQVALDVTYLAYQDVIDAFQHTEGWTSKRGMQKVNEQLRKGLPEGLEELARLGRTLWPGWAQVPAFYKRGGASNGPVEAINGRLEHLRGIGLGFGHFTHYVHAASSKRLVECHHTMDSRHRALLRPQGPGDRSRSGQRPLARDGGLTRGHADGMFWRVGVSAEPECDMHI